MFNPSFNVVKIVRAASRTFNTVATPLVPARELTHYAVDFSNDLRVTYDESGGQVGPPQKANKLNNFAKQISFTLVNGYKTSVADILQTQIEDELGPEWRNFTSDVTVNFNPVDPYAAIDALLGNTTEIRSTFTAANQIKKEIKAVTQAKILQATSPGFSPVTRCVKNQKILFPDGSEENQCKEREILTPGRAVADLATQALGSNFKITGEVDTWQEVGVEALSTTIETFVQGGLAWLNHEYRDHLARKKQREAEDKIGVQGLGAFDPDLVSQEDFRA